MKIRAAHILIDTFSERERNSINSMKRIQTYGIEYIPYITQRYTNNAWKYQTPYDGWRQHGSGHFGAYRSFQDVVFKYFTEDLDAFMIFEADCMLYPEITPLNFADDVHRAIQFSEIYNVFNFSFGSRYYDGVIQSPILERDAEYKDFVITDKIIGCNCILMLKQNRELILKEFLHSHWDSPDIWFNSIFYKNRHKHKLTLGITENSITYQHEGESMVDGETKGTRE